jgi:hypothetical protein
MSYNIYKSDGTTVVIPDAVVDQTFNDVTANSGKGIGVQIVGLGAPEYIAAIAQNILQMTENFSGTTLPSDSTALQGQLWFNKTSGTNGDLYVRTSGAVSGGIVNWKKLLVDSTTTLTGNLTFAGTNQFITGDWSTTLTRPQFRTSVVNDVTLVVASPNGTGTQAGFVADNNSDSANAELLFVGPNASNTAMLVYSGARGAGTPKQMAIVVESGAPNDYAVLINANNSTSIHHNLILDNTSQFITGDWSTTATRPQFRTNVVNEKTLVTASPNGTGTQSGFVADNKSDSANSELIFLGPNASNTAMLVYSGARGTGTPKQMAIVVESGLSNDYAILIDTSNNVTMPHTLNVQDITFTGAGPVSISSGNDLNLEAVGIITFSSIAQLVNKTKVQLNALAGVPAGSIAYCTDTVSGAVPVYYSGAAWLKVFDNGAI